MRKKTVSVIMGLLVVAGGIFFGAQVLGYWPEYKVSFDGWWTLFIIVPCIISIFNSGLNMFNSIGTGLGILFLLNEQGVLKDNIGYRLSIPYVLIVFGLSLILRRSSIAPKEGNNGIFAGSKGQNYFAVFGGNTPQFNGVEFRGANAYAVFGGVDLKLQNAIIRRDCVINAYSIFGGTDIILPKNVRVVVSSIPVFGGVENRFVSEAAEGGAPTVFIRAVSIFGGTDIK